MYLLYRNSKVRSVRSVSSELFPFCEVAPAIGASLITEDGLVPVAEEAAVGNTLEKADE